MIKILRKKENKEFGTKKRKILSGKKISKIIKPNNKREKKHIKNGEKNQS